MSIRTNVSSSAIPSSIVARAEAVATPSLSTVPLAASLAPALPDQMAVAAIQPTAPPISPTLTAIPSPTPPYTLSQGSASDEAQVTFFSADVLPSSTPPTGAAASWAILFLRDRSKSVSDLCGDRFQESMKDIPDFFYHFFAGAPALAGTQVYLGLDSFPEQTPGAFVLRPIGATALLPTGESAWTETDWRMERNNAWSGTFEDRKGFEDAIERAVQALAPIPATEKHLVVFGDGILNYNYSNEWDHIKRQIPAADPAAGSRQWLLSRLSDAGIRLHYVLVDCLPREGEASKGDDAVDTGEYTEDNLFHWDEIDGVEHNVEEPFRDNTWIKVYGLNEYLGQAGLRQQELAVYQAQFTDEPNLPPPDTFLQLLHNLAGPLLPPAVDPALDQDWSGRSALLLPGDHSLGAPNPGSAPPVDLRLPQLRYAYEQETTLLSLEPRLGLFVNDTAIPTDTNQYDDVRDVFPVRPAEAGGCAANWFAFGLPDKTGEEQAEARLTYPAIVWWQPNVAYPEALTVTLKGVEYIPPDNSYAGQEEGLAAHSRTVITSTISFGKQGVEDGFLNDCYRAEVRVVDPAAGGSTASGGAAPSDPEASMTTEERSRIEALPWSTAVPIPFAPLEATSPLTLTLELVLWRNETPVELRTRSSQDVSATNTEWKRVLSRPLPPIELDYRPTLSHGGAFSCTNDLGQNEMECSLHIDYTDASYYPEGEPALPGIYLLATRPPTSPNCAARGEMPDEADEVRFEASEELWYEADLDGGAWDDLLHERPSLPQENENVFAFKFRLSELHDCGISTLLLYWEDAPDIKPVYCTMVGKLYCRQGDTFTRH